MKTNNVVAVTAGAAILWLLFGKKKTPVTNPITIYTESTTAPETKPKEQKQVPDTFIDEMFAPVQATSAPGAPVSTPVSTPVAAPVVTQVPTKPYIDPPKVDDTNIVNIVNSFVKPSAPIIVQKPANPAPAPSPKPFIATNNSKAERSPYLGTVTLHRINGSIKASYADAIEFADPYAFKGIFFWRNGTRKSL